MSMDNERRADLGAMAVFTAASETNVAAVDSAETAVIDVLAYVAHLCDRLGIDPDATFAAGLQSYAGDADDGPPAEYRAESKNGAAQLTRPADSPLPDPPADLADAWARFQNGGDVSTWELQKLDEWRADCARDAGF